MLPTKKLHRKPTATIQILEQPCGKTHRFRYGSESRTAGSILGANSTTSLPTYPKIQIQSYQGPAAVIVSCVTKDEPYLPHPHRLVGSGCSRGIYRAEIDQRSMTMEFKFGIQNVKRENLTVSLQEREEDKVDPFGGGFAHKSQPASMDLHAVRLCFQVFIPIPATDGSGKRFISLRPVVSDVIHDQKTLPNLKISKLSKCNCPATGGNPDEPLILLCEKVKKDDVGVRFYEEGWEAVVPIGPNQVHKSAAIVFTPPAYRNLHIDNPVLVMVQLFQPKDGSVGEAVPFEYLPLDRTSKRKRGKWDFDHLQQDILGRMSQSERTTLDQIMHTPVMDVKMEYLDGGDPLWNEQGCSSWTAPCQMGPVESQNDLNNVDSGELQRVLDCMTVSADIPCLNQELSDYFASITRTD